MATKIEFIEVPVIVIGAGGHARVLLDVLQQQKARILGLVDADPALHDALLLGEKVLGGDDVVRRYAPEEVFLVNAIGSVRQPVARQKVYENFKALGYKFATVVHPSAVVSPHATLADGVQVMAGVIVQAGATIGENTLVNTAASVDHDCSIGKHVHLSPRATLCGNVKVGDGAHIGAAATLIQGVAVGCAALVGAGAVVIRDVSDNQTVLGSPARPRQ